MAGWRGLTQDKWLAADQVSRWTFYDIRDAIYALQGCDEWQVKTPGGWHLTTIY